MVAFVGNLKVAKQKAAKVVSLIKWQKIYQMCQVPFNRNSVTIHKELITKTRQFKYIENFTTKKRNIFR